MWEQVLEIIVSTDAALLHLIDDYGILTYAILFLIIYAETGLLFFPFLPGDGLLFSIGVIAGVGYLDLYWLLILLITAAYLGNMTSFYIGRNSAKYLMRIKNQQWQSYILRAHDFYVNYGGKAVLIARFFPILRTYIPFVAGVAEMDRHSFSKYSFTGAIIWVASFLLLGYFLGEITWVRENYAIIFLILIIVTILPLPVRFLIDYFKRKSAWKQNSK